MSPHLHLALEALVCVCSQVATTFNLSNPFFNLLFGFGPFSSSTSQVVERNGRQMFVTLFTDQVKVKQRTQEAINLLYKSTPNLALNRPIQIKGKDANADQSELYELQNDVGLLLEAFLRESTANKKAPPKVEMERQIKEVVYVIEDTIDSCLTQLSATVKGKNLLRYLNPKRANLAKEVRSLRERLKPLVDKVIRKDFADMQIGDKSGTSVDEPHMKLEKAVVHQDLHVSSQDKFVGLEDETETIIKYVMEAKDKLDVISIVGMPGLGKTTLAWKIYQNHNIQYEFPTRIWVNISLVFNRREVLLRILKEFTSQDMSSLSDHDLANKVHECLKTGKILLVMDDVWGVEDWNTLRDVLPKSNRMGKVLITSRYTNVAVYANPGFGIQVHQFHQFPKGVTKLIHLRYITLSGDNLRVLPEAISELWNLQTIVVNTKSRQITVKANIWRMIQLRHLKTTAAIVLDIQGEGEGGENLQTLSRLSPEYCTDYVFYRARNIKTLGIFSKLASLVYANSLQKLHRLENLKLLNDLIYESASEYRLNGLPQPNCFPPNLKRLTLSATFLDWNHMSALVKIGTLEVLKLKDNAFTGKFWNAVGDSFHSLQFLLIADRT
ncbi:hypothetical protein DH2020_019199 [Rehmannia glutinosa]|uniref:NB-ARC domain-containing protein n=1 Tax=Rehmannia glutinosa TaxID=99300 RepID=A0ABR0WPM4_REHGL